MNIGERIYNLRTERNLSQGDLAELLDVSRQSVSKWETGTASPDLDKIIKLSEIFGISIDELVKGEGETPKPAEEPPKPTEQTPPQQPQVKYVYVEKEQKLPPRKIAALILLCMGFLLTCGFIFAGGGLAGAVLGIPFWMACFVCFAVPRHTAIWALWADYVLLDIYFRYGTAANPSMVFNAVYYNNDFIAPLFVAWIWVIIIAALIIATAVAFRKYPIKNPKTLKNLVGAACIFIIVKDIGLNILSQTKFFVNMFALGDVMLVNAYFIISNALQLLSILLIAFIITSTVRLVLQHPKKFK